MEQIRLATKSGLKGKDDCLDTISMLGYLNPWKPSQASPTTEAELSMWDDDDKQPTISGLSSYIV